MSKRLLLASLLAAAACTHNRPTEAITSPPADAPDLVLSDPPDASPLTITRVDHATTLVDFDGEVVLTDPWFTENWMYHPGEKLGTTIAKLPKLTAVVVSHKHYDHFDIDAFKEYPDKDVPFFVVAGIGDKVKAAGFHNVRELAPWESGTAGSLTITAAPGAHSAPEITFVLQGKGRTVYFGGDTKRITPLVEELPRRFPTIDVALLPVNGLKEFGTQQVMSADDAAQLTADLHARVAVPIHYAYTGGKLKDLFVLDYDGTPEEFQAQTAKLSPQTTVRILSPGQRQRIVASE
ncbi:MAG TPA: MBL fold metallo-hydrolase [Kofleriaceae bacterium]|nr:MBL fold metallo-hydrolase [Kofleriaceae bacterium]